MVTTASEKAGEHARDPFSAAERRGDGRTLGHEPLCAAESPCVSMYSLRAGLVVLSRTKSSCRRSRASSARRAGGREARGGRRAKKEDDEDAPWSQRCAGRRPCCRRCPRGPSSCSCRRERGERGERTRRGPGGASDAPERVQVDVDARVPRRRPADLRPARDLHVRSVSNGERDRVREQEEERTASANALFARYASALSVQTSSTSHLAGSTMPRPLSNSSPTTHSRVAAG